MEIVGGIVQKMLCYLLPNYAHDCKFLVPLWRLISFKRKQTKKKSLSQKKVTAKYLVRTNNRVDGPHLLTFDRNPEKLTACSVLCLSRPLHKPSIGLRGFPILFYQIHIYIAAVADAPQYLKKLMNRNLI